MPTGKQSKPTTITTYTELKRGRKQCNRCGVIVGAKLRVCKCGYVFEKVSKLNTSHSTEKTHWKDLHKGDIISVKRGSGPYWQLKSGEIEYLGESGIFKVAYLCEDGIHAYPLKSKNGSGHRFIYMGKYCESNIGVVREPHRIRKVTKLNGAYAKL